MVPDLVEVRGDGSLRLLTADLLAEYGVEPRGVLHVGAHHGEEVPIYRTCGFGRIVLVEPSPAACAVIRQAYPTGVDVVQGAVVSEGAFAVFRESQRSVASGMAPTVPNVAATLTGIPLYQVDKMQARWPDCNVLVVDTQGTELDVLHTADLDGLDLVVVETDEAGRDASPHADVVEFLADAGWLPVRRWRHGAHPYADVAFIREAGRA